MIELLLKQAIDGVRKGAGAGLEVVKAQQGARNDTADNSNQMNDIGKNLRSIGEKIYDKAMEAGKDDKALEAVANATTAIG